MPCNRHVNRRNLLQHAAAGGLILVWPLPALAARKSNKNGKDPYYAYAVDTSRCIGCCACMRACRAENDVPASYFRTWIERFRVQANGKVDVDVAGAGDHVFREVEKAHVAKAFFVPKLCNHCERSVCTQVCPVGATYDTPDGVVLVDHKRCIGCGYCVQACPYGTRFINPETHMADKCTLCYHRIKRGKKPACVLACPKQVRMFGDLNNPEDPLSIALKQRRFRLLKPEMGTHSKCYYLELDFEVV